MKHNKKGVDITHYVQQSQRHRRGSLSIFQTAFFFYTTKEAEKRRRLEESPKRKRTAVFATPGPPMGPCSTAAVSPSVGPMIEVAPVFATAVVPIGIGGIVAAVTHAATRGVTVSGGGALPRTSGVVYVSFVGWGKNVRILDTLLVYIFYLRLLLVQFKVLLEFLVDITIIK